MADKSVAAVILNYNTRNFLEKFLPAVLHTSYSNFKVVVIDNASTDDSVAFMQESYPEIQLIVLEKNFGFAGGYNEGLKQVSADYFILLNSDVEVTPQWVSPIIEVMEADQKIAAAQPKIRSYREGHLFEYAGASGGFIDSLAFPFCRGRVFDHCEQDHGQYNETREVFWASGAAMFVRSSIWNEVGGLDADYFAHMEEIDLCWRLKNRGYKIMVVPESVVYHVGGGTLTRESPRKTLLNFRNALVTMLKNMGAGELIWKIPAKLVLDGIAGIRFFLTGQWSNTLAIIRAHFLFYKGFFYWLGKRKEARGVQDFNQVGKMTGSVVFAYFIRRKTRFDQLDAHIRK
ncbi:MAG: glycosyltransferase family 2 protein [Bacteroidetes bacterium]|nr:MAG: glycosyltransferase family 2 protein [Bacteroidota bacterium]